MQKRTSAECNILIAQSIEHIMDRYLDPKNEAKGSHLNIDALKICRLIQIESLELLQAYRNEEGIERELSECGDIILYVLFRIDQIIKEKSRVENNHIGCVHVELNM